MTIQVLVIDDEEPIVDLLTAYLENEGYRVLVARDGPAGLRAAQASQPDIIVLDVMLPLMDGIEVLNRLRRDSNAYVIMLTARSDEVDKVVGLSMGADDYMTKPFSPRELVARIKAAMRRLHPADDADDATVLVSHRVRIDVGRRQVWVDGRPVELTEIEFDLLRALVEHRGRVLSREQLLERVWGYDFYGEARVVDVHVGHIRQKVGDAGLIGTVRGVGYRFEDDTA